MSIEELEYYDVSPTKGCLWDQSQSSVSVLPELAVVEEIASTLPDILPSGRIRSYMRGALPDVDPSPALIDCSDAQARASLNHYLFLVQAYVWGERERVSAIPRFLAVPVCSLASRLRQPPILTYRNYVLENWACLGPTENVVLENIRIPLQFLGGQDEHWFIAVHVAVEAAAAQALRLVKPLVDSCHVKDVGSTQLLLEEFSEVLSKVNSIFDRMIERCEPFIYYERVRPFIHGWKDNPDLPGGLLYEGVEEFGGKPQQFRGETGAQSAIIPIFDALFGVAHAENDDLRSYLDDLHSYRPVGHRLFIDEISRNSTVRSIASAASNKRLKSAYNSCISHLVAFRAQHLEFARKYVFEQIDRASFGAPKVGTGGTPFVRYLGKHHREAADSLLTMEDLDE
jgi:indoleamine 2,3-dioxygenase